MPQDWVSPGRWLGVLIGFALVELSAGAGPSIVLAPVVSGLTQPVFVTPTPVPGDGRLFVVEQGGRIRIVENGVIRPVDFLNVSSTGLDLVEVSFEQGLLGLAFHPDYVHNGLFYISYTRKGDGDSIVSRFAVSADPHVAQTAETIILGPVDQPQREHNGGMITFGPDGYLYVGLGDGGGTDDNDSGHTAGIGNGQDINKLLGKILRLNLDAAFPYAIPPTNPFAGAIPGRDEIFAHGFRNPWRFSFDRLTGTLLVGDVGQFTAEEIDIVSAGDNCGWRILEGDLCHNPIQNCVPPAGHRAPLHTYLHVGLGASVTGGYVYRGSQSPGLFGHYIFGDYETGQIWALPPTGPASWSSTAIELIDTLHKFSSFGEEQSGELLVCDLMGGQIFRLRDPAGPSGLVLAGQP